ncbi:hypothetical protein NM09_16225 [Vibrio caribbeanicus]|uniref:Uncharacterized protein n=1 Tax=Vibrio caribbeanicus TaxID=701175 RepID=A0ACC4NUH8_9VIBR|nr:YfiR family protein [Vibrio caribbeanicus]KHD24049.1 hypothetical protein NM09_16225 [Vibrio caribbeanicus]
MSPHFSILATKCLVALGLLIVPLLAQAKVDDVDLKAVYLFRFALLSDWNQTDIATDHIDYCVAQQSDVGLRLEAIVATKPDMARFHDMLSGVAPSVCHILFIENGDEAIIANLHVRYPNALLVGNGVEFVANGGMVAFIKVRNRIRPLISRQNVEKSRVQIRSQLLEVSEIYEETT